MYGNFSGLNKLFQWDSASMTVEVSERNATRRLLQCRDFGLQMNDVSKRFQQPGSDLSEYEFRDRKRIIEDVKRYNESHGSERTWTPILYKFEIADNATESMMDWGHLVFADPTFTRFLLVMCYEPEQCEGRDHDCTQDCDEQIEFQANRFMSLLVYLSHDWEPAQRPQWVRATYGTPTHHITTVFLEGDQPVPQDSPPIVHVTATDFVPYLSESELEHVDTEIVQSNRWTQPPRSLWDSVKSDLLRPIPRCGLMKKSPEECTHCGKLVVDGTGMRECPKCKLVKYCDRQCQRGDWNKHRQQCQSISRAATPTTLDFPEPQ